MKIKDLINEIDITLERNDINQKEFIMLQSLKYLLINGYFPLEEIKHKLYKPVDEWNYSEGK